MPAASRSVVMQAIRGVQNDRHQVSFGFWVGDSSPHAFRLPHPQPTGLLQARTLISEDPEHRIVLGWNSDTQIALQDPDGNKSTIDIHEP